MIRRTRTVVAMHLLMVAITGALAALAVFGRSAAWTGFFEDEDGMEYGFDSPEAEDDPSVSNGAPAHLPAGVPPPGSPLLDGQERVEGLDRFAGEELHFEFGWRGAGALLRVVAASGRARVVRRNLNGREMYIVQANGRTSGIVRRLWNMRGSIESVVDGPTGLVLRHTMVEKENRRHSKQVLVFREDGRSAERLRIRYHRDPSDDGHERLDENACLIRMDAATLAYALRTAEHDGQHLDLAFFDGEYTYGIHLHRRRRERVTVKAGTFDAYRYRVTFSDKDRPPDERGEDKVRRVRMWVTADEWRVPILLESDTFVGQVFGELARWDRPAGATR